MWAGNAPAAAHQLLVNISLNGLHTLGEAKITEAYVDVLFTKRVSSAGFEPHSKGLLQIITTESLGFRTSLKFKVRFVSSC